jgi:hypothetical protein
VKYYTESAYTLDYTGADFMDGPPSDFFQQIFVGPSDVDSEVESAPHLELGIGALATLGTISVGAYLDNLLFFLDLTGEAVEVNFVDLFDSLSVGAAWTPFDNKLKEKRGILNLIAAVDFRNIGDDVNREIALGGEIGLNLGRVIMLNTRLGYNQSLPGTLIESLSDINPTWEHTPSDRDETSHRGVQLLDGVPLRHAHGSPHREPDRGRIGYPFGTGVFEVRMSF